MNATARGPRHAGPRHPIADRLSARLGVTSLAVAGRPIERRLVAAGLPSSLGLSHDAAALVVAAVRGDTMAA